MISEQLIITSNVIRILEDQNITYLIGGSLASSLHGVVRATMDIDIVVNLKESHVPELIKAFEENYYIDEEMILSALNHKTNFNLIHYKTSFKIDVFISKDTPFEKSQFNRRQLLPLSRSGSQKGYFASPEDICLAKLEWFRLGGEISDRQWQDVLGIIKLQQDNLDKTYLNKWAKKLEIQDLLGRIYKQI